MGGSGGYEGGFWFFNGGIRLFNTGFFRGRLVIVYGIICLVIVIEDLILRR